MQILKDMANELEKVGKNLFVGIVHDEMSLREHLEFSYGKKAFSGFITFGKVSDDTEIVPLATNVLVFQVHGISIPFHLPIAYYFITSLEGIDKVVLITSIIDMLKEIGVSVLTSTFDGFASNLTACEILGCSFELNDFRPNFGYPDEHSLIYPFLDPSHMLKLIRNCLLNVKTIYDRLGRAIEWRYFQKLVQLRDNDNLITHKMTKAHINLQNSDKMKVSYAAQTFSDSVATSMEYLMRRQHPDFINAGATIELARRMDRLFDVLNSNEQTENVYKSPVTADTVDSLFPFLDDTVDYLRNLTFEAFKKPIVDSNLKVGFKGMIINIQNTKSIYNSYVRTGKLDQFPVRRVGQCPLESLFSRCRSHSMLGCNTNPTVSQFKSLMRKIIVNNEVTSSQFANCSDKLDILTVSSQPKKSASCFSNGDNSIELDDPDSIATDAIFADIDDESPQQPHVLHVDDPSNETIGIVHMAGEIDRRIENGTNLNCTLCRSIIEENSKLSISSIPIGKYTKIPTKTTYEICNITHQSIKSHVLNRTFKYKETINSVYCQTSQTSVFPNSNFSFHPDHKKNITIYIHFYVCHTCCKKIHNGTTYFAS